MYVVIREAPTPPTFLAMSIGGHFKGKDPTVPVATLQAKWVPVAQVIYVGKAGAGAAGRRGLRKRLDEYRQFGAGRPVGHYGGRYVWQLADSADLHVAWLATPERDAAQVERELLAEFIALHGARPFANLLGG